MVRTSPEHVIPRSVGGDAWTAEVHPGCNRRANDVIDTMLPRCGHVGHVRAAVGVTNYRTGVPYEEHLLGRTVLMTCLAPGSSVDISDKIALARAFETGTDHGGRGALVQVAMRGKDNVAARFVPNPVLAEDGTVYVFASDGDDDAPPDSAFDPVTVLALVETSRRCFHGDGLWARFTAKVGLGLLALLAEPEREFDDGTAARDCLAPEASSRLAQRLRRIAFGDSSGSFPGHPYGTPEPAQPSAKHVAGFARASGHAVLVVRLFEYLNYRLDFPDIPINHDVEVSIPIRKLAPGAGTQPQGDVPSA